jgi:hypothetical protein
MGFAKLGFRCLDSGRIVHVDMARSCCLGSSGVYSVFGGGSVAYANRGFDVSDWREG